MPPQPKIMIIGQKGAGATTQIAKMCAKYKIENLELAKNYLQTLKKIMKDLKKNSNINTISGNDAVEIPAPGLDPFFLNLDILFLPKFCCRLF